MLQIVPEKYHTTRSENVHVPGLSVLLPLREGRLIRSLICKIFSRQRDLEFWYRWR